jgi:methionine sulfoxide reductase heme-binding subunit
MTLFGPSTLWYLSRASGLVALVLFTMAVALGLLTAGRVSSPRWPRFATESLHRNASMLAVAMTFAHVLTVVVDEYVDISVVDALVPFTAGYLPVWTGLGALAFDVMLAVSVTSVLRARLGHRSWRAVHWLAYAGWPVAVMHSVGIATDRVAVLVLLVVSAAAVTGAAVVRLAAWRRLAMRRPV